MGLVPRGRGLRDPDLRDRLYELLEHDPLAYSAGSRFIQLIIGVIVLNVAAMILASVRSWTSSSVCCSPRSPFSA